MDHGKEFKKYAIQHHGINSLYYDQLVSSMTPYIIEERQMNVAQMDVFSRLMMDRWRDLFDCTHVLVVFSIWE